MRSLWNPADAAEFQGELGQRVYTSRLLGRDHSLVLHGGGNTSVKVQQTNLYGYREDVLYIKGRGYDLERIDAAGFSPCRLEHLLRMSELPALSDAQMDNELALSRTRVDTPVPSVETLLHAILPAKFVDHTHADALLAVMNSPNGRERVQEIYGNRVVIVPYVMPGFKLVRACLDCLHKQETSQTVGLALMHHGVFSFGASAKQSYERMIELVDRAEQYIIAQQAWEVLWPTTPTPVRAARVEIAQLRRALGEAAGAPMIMTTHTDPQALGFARRSDVAEISQRGGITPDHVIRTKRVPLVGRDVSTFVEVYKEYVREHAAGREASIVDPAPRIILDPDIGLCAVGRSAEAARVAEEIYRHTIDTILRAERLGGWRALRPKDFFDVEYWEMERAKLAKEPDDAMFLGEIALVTGAASGIGSACVKQFLKHGAAVVGLDVSPTVGELYAGKSYLGIRCDLTDENELIAALERAVGTFGGLDMLVLNAGIFPSSTPVAALSRETWRRTMDINLDANVVLLRECHALLKLSPRGGRVVVVGSKNVVAPGPGAAAYSASKAALQQLARVTALEWGADRIRINTLHPNAVFDTGIWTPEVLAARAKSYGLSVNEYKTNNVLKTELTSHDVAALVTALCGPLFSKTTGAQIPVDGGNTRVI